MSVKLHGHRLQGHHCAGCAIVTLFLRTGLRRAPNSLSGCTGASYKALCPLPSVRGAGGAIPALPLLKSVGPQSATFSLRMLKNTAPTRRPPAAKLEGGAIPALPLLTSLGLQSAVGVSFTAHVKEHCANHLPRSSRNRCYSIDTMYTIATNLIDSTTICHSIDTMHHVSTSLCVAGGDVLVQPADHPFSRASLSPRPSSANTGSYDCMR